MIVTINDLPSSVQQHELALTMVDGANARALRVAPCLAEDGKDAARAEAKLILIGSVQRWSEAGSGAMQAVTAGPFQQAFDTRQRTGFNLWPSEVEVLQSLCSVEGEGAYSVDTVSTTRLAAHPFLTGG